MPKTLKTKQKKKNEKFAAFDIPLMTENKKNKKNSARLSRGERRITTTSSFQGVSRTAGYFFPTKFPCPSSAEKAS
jgi:hypothetical protein